MRDDRNRPGDGGIPHVEFRNVSKTYDGRTRVVDALNIAIRKSEFLTLLGPSGSGKTTSLMMLAGFETVSEGQLLVEGRVVNELPSYRRDIGVVFQNYALFPHMTTEENIAYPLLVRRMASAEIKRRVQASLEMVKLSGFGDRKPSKLSGGQQQRVALARALVFEPKLVLLDEPLGALDRQLREHMQYELKRIHDALGVTMIYVTHDQSEALTMSDRVAVFNDGLVQQLGTPEDLYCNPANMFVASFIGENNFIPVRVDNVSGDRVTVSGGNIAGIVARTDQRLSTGDKATLTIRPERLRLGAAAEACRNEVPVRVTSATFLGDHMRLAVLTPTGSEIIVKHPLASRFSPPTPGEQLVIGFEPEDAIVLEGQQGVRVAHPEGVEA